MRDLNPRHSRCKRDALPTELITRFMVMGLGGLEPPTLRLSGVYSNQLSYKPQFLI